MRIHTQNCFSPIYVNVEDPDFKQVAGHPNTVRRTAHGTIIKKADERERSFYAMLGDYPDLSMLLPAYYGEQPFDNEIGIELADLTSGYSKPSVMDIKMGTCTWDDQASEEKRGRASAKDAASCTSSLGFRIAGNRVYDVVEAAYRELPKEEALHVSAEAMPAALRDFLWDGSGVHSDLLPVILGQLASVHAWFLNNRELRFTASSILFVYEGDPAVDDPQPPTVKMIDFAHVEKRDEDELDNGYVFGLTTLCELLQAV